MKRIYLILLIGFSLILASCNPTNKTTIEFWHNYSAGDGQIEALEELIKEFEKANPDIKVEHVFLEWGALKDSVTLGSTSGVLPDLLRGDIAFVPQFQSLNVLLEMSSFDDYNDIANTILEQPNSANLMNNKYYGIAANTNTKILFYNKDILNNKEVSVPETLDELMTAAGLVSDENVIGYVEPWTGIWNIGPYIWSEGGDILAPDYSTATNYLNGEVTISVVSKLKEMYDSGYLTGPSLDPSALGDTDGWAAGKYAFQLDGPWREASNKDANVNYGAIPMPPGSNGSISVLGGESFMQFKTSNDAKKDAAWKFTKFLLSEEAQVKMATKGQMPVNLDALENDTALEALPLLPVFAEALETAKARPVIPQWAEIEDVIAAAVAEAILGSKTIETALNDATTAVNALLNK